MEKECNRDVTGLQLDTHSQESSWEYSWECPEECSSEWEDEKTS